MKPLYATIIALVALSLFGCSEAVHRRHVNAAMRNVPVRTVEFHADTGFKADERAMIAEAAASIGAQTSGYIRVGVTYDLDFDDVNTIVRWSNNDMLVRAPPSAPFLTFNDSSRRLLGVVGHVDLIHYDSSTPKVVYIVADRLWNHEAFVHVIQHEMYHAFGLRHVDDTGSIMFWEIRGEVPSTCINESDANELCRVIGCHVQDISYCD